MAMLATRVVRPVSTATRPWWRTVLGPGRWLEAAEETVVERQKGAPLIPIPPTYDICDICFEFVLTRR